MTPTPDRPSTEPTMPAPLDRRAPRGAHEFRVGLLGLGAINSVVCRELVAGAVPGARVVAVVTIGGETPPDPVVLTDIDTLVQTVDLVVEAASHEALDDHGETILTAGRDLLVVSVGALADEGLFQRLTTSGPGRLTLTTGAVGGLDLLQAAVRAGPLESVTLTTTKRASSLVQPWMDAALITKLEQGTDRIELFRGPAREAATRFPRSLNVAAALALAVGTWDGVEVVLIGDPNATATVHAIDAVGAIGGYHFETTNAVSKNPTTSSVTAYAVLRGVAAIAARRWSFV
jgi:aspartate dehydrogenase